MTRRAMVTDAEIDEMFGPAMDMRIVCNFTVPGEPVPKARPRFNFRTGRVYTPDRTVAAEQRIAEHLKVAFPHLQPATGRIKFKAVFYMKGAGRGDWDNYGKLISDALNGKAWVDDKQVDQAEVLLIRDSGNPRIDIIVYEFTPREAA